MPKQFLCGCTEVKPCAEHRNRNTDADWRDVDALLQSGVKVQTPQPCLVRHPGCEGLTLGSVGVASGVLRPLCPPCAAVEDGALVASIRNQGRLMDELLEAVAPTPLTTSEVQ